ncbi:hypothetical protein QUB68_10075 [Microcoleus sp. A006_D1]|uniref:hypothetical protein n=1 Tax=Microcoleus sp. A006_D1 TaxID=3055267 RepID=UPI002FCEF9A6
MWKTLPDGPKQFLWENGRAIDSTSFSTNFPQAFISYNSSATTNYFIFPQFPQGDPKNNSIKKSVPPTVNSSLLLLSTLNCQLSTANSQLPTLNSQLPTANCQLPTANCQLPTANCQLSSAFCDTICFCLKSG